MPTTLHRFEFKEIIATLAMKRPEHYSAFPKDYDPLEFASEEVQEAYRYAYGYGVRRPSKPVKV